jgi:3-hydroxybutyryl-CoA dehydratase
MGKVASFNLERGMFVKMLLSKKLSQLCVGENIPPLTRKVTQEKINRYAEASGDYNPIHIDPEFAKDTYFKGTIAHGLLSLAYISQMMNTWLGEFWLKDCTLDVTFLSPIFPGDEVIANGTVVEIKEENNKKNIICQVYCDGINGRRYITGIATITI